MIPIDKKLFHYMCGKGLDTSREPLLTDYIGADVICLFKEPNNLYRFHSDEEIQYESFDFIFNNELLTQTKFSRVLIKEWFNLLRPGGNLVTRFRESKSITGDNVNELFANLMGDTGEVLYVEKDEKNLFTVVTQKLRNVLSESDEIDRWSFCIINSPREDITRLIHSIQSQRIPHYEILVSSPVSLSEHDEDLRFLEVEGSSDDIGFPTAVIKNKMLLSARYENVVIIDRRKADIVLSSNWYQEVKRYSGYFEALSCALITPQGERCADWWTLGCDKRSSSENIFQTSMLGLLEYRDWDSWVYFSDPICVLKRNLYLKSLWDERSIDGDENTLFSHQLHSKGALLRMNPDLVCIVDNAKAEFLARNFPLYEYDTNKLGKRKRKVLRRTMWAVVETMLKVGLFNRALDSVVKSVKKSKIYRVIVR